MNFNIVETNWTKEFNNTYEKIKKDYANEMSVKDIKSKYGLTDGKWGAYRKQLMTDGLLQTRKEKTEPRFYSVCKTGYLVQKVIDHHKYYIATFKTESQAKKCVELMKECNWDLTQKENIIQTVRENNGI